MELFINAIIFLGSFACLSAGIGILRFQDFFQRLHAISKSATLGVFLIYLAAILSMPDWDRLPVLLLVMIFMAFSTPLSTHLMATAALKCRLKVGNNDVSNPSISMKKELDQVS